MAPKTKRRHHYVVTEREIPGPRDPAQDRLDKAKIHQLSEILRKKIDQDPDALRKAQFILESWLKKGPK